MPLVLRYMTSGDVPAVAAIDRAAFAPPWSAASFHFEIHQSRCSFMVVLTEQGTAPVVGWRRWWRRLRGQPLYLPNQPLIRAFGGLWKIEAEAHISTIASHPQQRGKKYGEIVLAAMLMRALDLGAGYVVLEVRVSNTIAQNLYAKYGFTLHSVRKGYYQNNREDAFDMRVDLTDAAVVAHIEGLYAALRAQVAFEDRYTTMRHPRLGI